MLVSWGRSFLGFFVVLSFVLVFFWGYVNPVRADGAPEFLYIQQFQPRGSVLNDINGDGLGEIYPLVSGSTRLPDAVTHYQEGDVIEFVLTVADPDGGDGVDTVFLQNQSSLAGHLVSFSRESATTWRFLWQTSVGSVGADTDVDLQFEATDTHGNVSNHNVRFFLDNMTPALPVIDFSSLLLFNDAGQCGGVECYHVDEDSTLNQINLHRVSQDIDTPDEYLQYRVVGNSNPGFISASIAEGYFLSIDTLIVDANSDTEGWTEVTVEVEDELGQTSQAFVRVWVDARAEDDGSIDGNIVDSFETVGLSQVSGAWQDTENNKIRACVYEEGWVNASISGETHEYDFFDVADDGRAVVVWMDQPNTANAEVRFSLFDSNGDTIRGNALVSDHFPAAPIVSPHEEPYMHSLPQVYMDDGGDFVVIWSRVTNIDWVQVDYKIFAKKFDADGHEVVSEVELAQYHHVWWAYLGDFDDRARSRVGVYQLAMNEATGQFGLLFFNQINDNTGEGQLLVRRFDNDVQALGADFVVYDGAIYSWGLASPVSVSSFSGQGYRYLGELAMNENGKGAASYTHADWNGSNWEYSLGYHRFDFSTGVSESQGQSLPLHTDVFDYTYRDSELDRRDYLLVSLGTGNIIQLDDTGGILNDMSLQGGVYGRVSGTGSVLFDDDTSVFLPWYPISGSGGRIAHVHFIRLDNGLQQIGSDILLSSQSLRAGCSYDATDIKKQTETEIVTGWLVGNTVILRKYNENGILLDPASDDEQYFPAIAISRGFNVGDEIKQVQLKASYYRLGQPDMDFYLSADGGTTWHLAENPQGDQQGGYVFGPVDFEALDNMGQFLRWKAIMPLDSSGRSNEINEIQLHYTVVNQSPQFRQISQTAPIDRTRVFNLADSTSEITLQAGREHTDEYEFVLFIDDPEVDPTDLVVNSATPLPAGMTVSCQTSGDFLGETLCLDNTWVVSWPREQVVAGSYSLDFEVTDYLDEAGVATPNKTDQLRVNFQVEAYTEGQLISGTLSSYGEAVSGKTVCAQSESGALTFDYLDPADGGSYAVPVLVQSDGETFNLFLSDGVGCGNPMSELGGLDPFEPSNRPVAAEGNHYTEDLFWGSGGVVADFMECKNGLEGNTWYFCEDFSDTSLRDDAKTTAVWDTNAEQLTLPFEPVLSSTDAVGEPYRVQADGAGIRSGLAADGVGDINGDGFADFLIGAPQASVDSRSSVGVTGLVLGGGDLGDYRDVNNPLGVTAQFLGQGTGEQSGIDVAGIGDVDGDGLDDFLIGAPGIGSGMGGAYLYYGDGSKTWSGDFILPDTADATFVGESLYSITGLDVAGLGDINNDGLDDFAMIAPHTGVSRNLMRVYIVLGQSSRWSGDQAVVSTSVSIFESDFTDVTNTYEFKQVAAAGDVNGDGYDDILIGEPWAGGTGKVHLILGKDTKYWPSLALLSTANAHFVGEYKYDEIGYMVTGLGDVNGDTYADFAIGASKRDARGENSGETYVFFGGASFWSGEHSVGVADASMVGTVAGDGVGASVDGLGDWDGDGLDDILITAPGADESGVDYGKAGIFLGRSAGWDQEMAMESADFIFLGQVPHDIRRADAVGDVNDDGQLDFLLSSWYAFSTQGISYLVTNTELQAERGYVSPAVGTSLPPVTLEVQDIFADVLVRDSAMGGAILELSNDGGGSWVEAVLGGQTLFSVSDDTPLWRANLESNDGSGTPQLEAVFLKVAKKTRVIDSFGDLAEEPNTYNWAAFDEWVDGDYYDISLNQVNQTLGDDPLEIARHPRADAGIKYGMYVDREMAGDIKPILGHAWIPDQNKWLAFSPGICQSSDNDGQVCWQDKDCSGPEATCLYYGDPLESSSQRDSVCNHLADGNNYLACFDEAADSGAGNMHGWAAVVDETGRVEAWVKLSETARANQCDVVDRVGDDICYQCFKQGDEMSCAVCQYQNEVLGYKVSGGDGRLGFTDCLETEDNAFTCAPVGGPDVIEHPKDYRADICHNYFSSINNQAKFEGRSRIWDKSSGSWAETSSGNQWVVWGPYSTNIEEAQHCRNGQQDEYLGELDVDCGGPNCQACGAGQVITSFIQVRYGSIFAEEGLESRFTPLAPEFTADFRLETSGIIRNLLSGVASLGCQTGSETEEACGFIREGVDLSFFQEVGDNVYANELGELDVAGMLAGRYAPVHAARAQDINGTNQVTFGEYVAHFAALSDLEFPLRHGELGGYIYHVDGDLVIKNPLDFNYGGDGVTGNTQGQGTIIVSGNLIINAPLSYQSTGNTDLSVAALPSVAFIVVPGSDPGDGENLLINADVANTVGAFIVPVGNIQTGFNDHLQYTHAGIMIAHAIQFQRTGLYGTIVSPEAAEIIINDGRITVNPPPGLRDISSSLPEFEAVVGR